MSSVRDIELDARHSGYPERQSKPFFQRVIRLWVTHTNLSVGCYRERAERCHWAVHGELLAAHGGELA